jgi:outer membrane protein OmpA-like peptidoglycan-associated protein
MTRLGALLATGALFGATPAFAQTVGNCAHGGGANQPQAVWVLFDLGSAQVRGDNKNKIAEAAVTAKARQVTSICVIGHTDKLGDKALNEQLARARSKAVAAELVGAGIPAKDIVIAADPEAFGNLSLGNLDAQGKDRKVTILFSR